MLFSLCLFHSHNFYSIQILWLLDGHILGSDWSLAGLLLHRLCKEGSESEEGSSVKVYPIISTEKEETGWKCEW